MAAELDDFESRLAAFHADADKRRTSIQADRKRLKNRHYKPYFGDRPFLAIDGEGWNIEGRHSLTVLGASDGSFIENRNGGLSFGDCMKYLFGLKSEHKHAIFVGFYLRYDWTMILKDIGEVNVKILRKSGSVFYQTMEDNSSYSYSIQYLPGKITTITKGKWIGERGQENRKWKREKSITIYDVWGFFQGSFVGALRGNGVGTAEQIAFVEDTKGKRERLDLMDIADVVRYNLLECTLLVDLMNKLRENITGAGLSVSSWHGAGALSSVVLRQYGIKNWLKCEDEEVNNAAMYAYFGGRIQANILGEHDGTVYSHDIVSAYPSACLELPVLTGSTWQSVRTFKRYRIGIYLVSWSVDCNLPIMPFPWRSKTGKILYMCAGRGWYWGWEVEAAIDLFGDGITVEKGFVIHENRQAAEARPFAFVPELFEQRKRLKAAGSGSQIAIKLCLNSLYGKLAQGEGYGGKVPAYQSYIWAGMITSITRAKILRLAMSKPEDVIAICTDGVYAKSRLAEDGHGELGTWEVGEYPGGMLICQPGVYQLIGENGKVEYSRVRGFRQSELSFETLRETWKESGVNGVCQFLCRRFNGLSIAVSYDKIGQWTEGYKSITFLPPGFAYTEDNGKTFRAIPVGQPGKLSACYDRSIYEDVDAVPDMDAVERAE